MKDKSSVLNPDQRAQLQEILGHEFKDEMLIIAALTHKSRSQEDNSERLEFLGDRVLALVITDMLLEMYPKASEGDLAKRLSQLVKRAALAEVGRAIGLPEFLLIGNRDGKGDNIRHQQKIIADATEAVIGALYMDGGADKARQFITLHWRERAASMTVAPSDAKSALQEWSLKFLAVLPHYELLEQSGPSHAPHFVVKVSVEDLGSATGEGKTRKAAEVQAAEQLYRTTKMNS